MDLNKDLLEQTNSMGKANEMLYRTFSG